MTSVAEARKARKQLFRDADRAERAALKKKHAALRAEILRVKQEQRATIRRVVLRCRAARQKLREKTKALRARALLELREAATSSRLQARDRCTLRKAEHRARARTEVERRRGEIQADRQYRAELKRIESWNRKTRPKIARAAVRRCESDDEVRANIPPELVGLFDRVRSSIKAGPRQTRTEAFLRYAEENEREVLAALEDGADRLVAEMEKQEREYAKRLRPVRRARAHASALASASAVPF